MPSQLEMQALRSAHQNWLRPESPITLIGNDIVGNLDVRIAQKDPYYMPSCDPGRADLSYANLNQFSLEHAELESAVVHQSTLQGAQLKAVNFRSAILTLSDFGPLKRNRQADISADLSDADLSGAVLSLSNLSSARLDNANLLGATLSGAWLIGTSVAGATFAYAGLSNAYYAPRSAPPAPYVAGITGLRTVIFPRGEETGLVQLRDLLQKAGLRNLEREATFAIESGKTRYGIDAGRANPADVAEGIFRLVAFDWTTAYGLHPARALILIAALWAASACVYTVPIWRRPGAKSGGAICRSWGKDRLELREGTLTRDNPARDERLHNRGPAAIGWAAYFSLLSAFQIGFREFSVGTWLSRAQPRAFTLEAIGWVRTLSGIQALLSVYLLAICILTYFGRPFQ